MWLVSMIIKNLIGYVLIIGGILMLVLPGQGLFCLYWVNVSNYPNDILLKGSLLQFQAYSRLRHWLKKDQIKSL